MAMIPWLINWWVIRTTYKSWDDPPSCDNNTPKMSSDFKGPGPPPMPAFLGSKLGEL